MQQSEQQTPRIGIALVQWNHAEYTLHLLKDLIESGLPFCRIAVCDNGSDKGVWEKLVQGVEQCLPISTCEQKKLADWKVALLRNRNNSGFAAGTNVSLNMLLQTELDWLWILNNDVSIERSELTRLASELEGKAPGVYGVSILDEFGEKTLGANIYNKWTTKYRPVTQQEVEKGRISKDCYINGASMIVHRSVIESIGLLSEETFLYFEELDFSIRLKKSPYKQGMIENVLIRHLGAGSSKGRDLSKMRMNHETWSLLAFYKKHYHRLFLYIIFVRTPLRLVTLILQRRYTELPAVIRATLDFLRGQNRYRQPVELIEKIFLS
jgi:GT2 family glycosyltransferase